MHQWHKMDIGQYILIINKWGYWYPTITNARKTLEYELSKALETRKDKKTILNVG